tara:strand:- start:142 stop:903 length:762 start_codon:yes stop_codon:yes gene_type:complete
VTKSLEKLKNFINKIFFKFGYRISKINNTGELVKIHKYKNYEEYKETQIHYNKQKLDKVWADKDTLKLVSNFLKENIRSEIIKGVCHGSRNGFEQKCFQQEIANSEVIGTDISETAKNFENSYIHDFHEEKKEWHDNFDFVYSNSLDQSYDPKKAVKTWFDQIKINRYLFIELTDQHTVQTSSKMDPFGIETYFFPYLLVEWFGSKISIEIIKNIKSNKMRERKVDMGEVIDGASFVAEGLTSYVFIVKKLND